MNGPCGLPTSLESVTIPVELNSLVPPPLLLPGESLDHYNLLRRAIFVDLDPQSALEWLLAIDVAEISWEIQRYRLLRHKVLAAFRLKAIEASLRRVDLAGIAPEFQDEAERYIQQNALSWQVDPIAAAEIENHLADYGIDHHALSMEVYVHAREIFTLFKGLLNAAQLKRAVILKQISNFGRHTNGRRGQSR